MAGSSVPPEKIAQLRLYEPSARKPDATKPAFSEGSSTAAPAPSPKKKIIGSFGSVSLCIM